MGRRKPVTEYADEDKQIAHEAAELEYDIAKVFNAKGSLPQSGRARRG
jgi:hypothetical protein